MKLERLVEQAAEVVEFDSKASEQAYQEAGWRLHLQVCGVMGMTLVRYCRTSVMRTLGVKMRNTVRC
jgi:hypothetical protein